MTTEVIVRVLFREILGNIQPFLKLGERLVTAAEAWFCVRAAESNRSSRASQPARPRRPTRPVILVTAPSCNADYLSAVPGQAAW